MAQWPRSDDFERDGAIKTFLAGPKYYALSAAANLLEQFVIAEVHQHRRSAAGVIRLRRSSLGSCFGGVGGFGGRVDPGYRFIRAQTRLQQTGAAGVLRGIGCNGCSASATKFDRCDSHRARIPFIQILHGNSPKVT